MKNEEELLRAALNEFSQNSFEDASLNRIIKKSGISKGTFYYRFKNKYDLYIYILKKANKKKWDFINKRCRENLQTDDIFDLFHYQADTAIEFGINNPKYHQLSRMFTRERGSDLYTRVINELGADDDSGIINIIEEAYGNNSFKREYSIEFVVKVISFLFKSFDDIFYNSNSTECELKENLKSYINFMRFGFSSNHLN